MVKTVFLATNVEMLQNYIPYIGFGFIGIIALCALIGFFRGYLKSNHYMIASLIIYVIGIILMKPVVSSLLYMDVSFINNYVSGLNIETPMKYITELIIEQYPSVEGLLVNDSYTLALVEGVASLVLNIVYLLLLLVLSLTVFHLISGIIWLIVKKPLVRKFGKQKGFKKNGKPKYKKPITSRLYGLVLGGVKGMLYTLLIGFIIAGVLSMVDSLKTIDGSKEMVVVCVEDTFTVVELSESNELPDNENKNSLIDDSIYQLLQSYRDTVPGKVYGSIKIGKDKTKFDEFIFDSLFKIEGKNGNIKIRSEFRKLAQALSNEAVKQIMTEGFDFSKLGELNDEDLKSLIDTISSLDSIKVVVPVGIEFVTYSDMLEEMLGPEYEDFKKTMQEKLPELLEIDYCQEVKSLGYIFVDVIDLLEGNLSDLSKVDYFNLDQDTLNSLFEKLGELDLLEVVAPITISYLLNSEAIKKSIESVGFTLQDLKLTSDVDYVSELLNLPNIYEKVIDLGIKKVDGKIDFSNVDHTKVEALVETLFTSAIIKNAVPVVATTLTKTYLPDEYKGFLPEETLKNVDWEKEFSPLLTAVALLMKTGMLDSKDKEPIQVLLTLEDEVFEELGKYFSKSELLCDNLNEFLNVLLKSLDFEGVTFTGLDSTNNEYWDELEITSLFKTVKKIAISLDRQLTDAEIEELAISISSSKYIKKNLNSLVNSLTRDLGFQLAELSDEQWTVNEIYSVFKSINIISSLSEGTSIKVENFLKLSDENLTIVLESSLIKDSLKKLITTREELSILKGVYEDGIDQNGNEVYSWSDKVINVSSSITGSTLKITANSDVLRYIIYKNNRYFTSTTDELSIDLNINDYVYNENDEFYVKGVVENGELRKVFTAISSLNIMNINSFNIDLRQVLNNRDSIFDSYILTETIINEIRKYDKESGSNGSGLEIPVEFKENGSGNWHGKTGELNKLINGLDALLSISVSDQPVYIDQLTNQINNLSVNNVCEKIDVILYSDILSFTLKNKIISLSEGSNAILNVPTNYEVVGSKNYIEWNNTYDANGNVVTFGETSNFFKAIKYVLPKDSSFNNIETLSYSTIFDTNVNENNVIPQDEILKSKIISETIINKIVFENSSTINVPSSVGLDNVDDRSKWFNEYDSKGKLVRKNELANLINSLGVMIDDNQMSNLQNLDVLDLIDSILPLFKNDEKLSLILRSYVISETIKNQVSTLKTFKDQSTGSDYITTAFTNNNKNVNASNNWYSMDANGNPEQKELWNLLKGVAILLGDNSLTNLNNISIEIFINNSDLVPTYDDNCNITSDKISVMLKSIVIEEIFVGISKQMLSDGGYLSAVLTVPSDVNWYKKDVSSNEEYDLLTFLQSFYIVQELFDYQNNKNILETANTICTLNTNEVNQLATGMVVSRIFRNNIEKMMNTIFFVPYGLKYSKNPSIKPWDSVKFNQSDYNGLTKVQAKNKFITAYNTMCTEINK